MRTRTPHDNLVIASAFIVLLNAGEPSRSFCQHGHDDNAEGAFQHVLHGPAIGFRAPHLPPPPLMDGIGNASMTITTHSQLAQSYFNQGLNLLHCFWDFEAYRAFKEAARLDSTCAMAYWGIFTSLKYNRREMAAEQRASLEKALQLGPLASDREQYYIKAANALMQSRANDYVRGMKEMVRLYPDDTEGQLILANFLTSGYKPDGTPRTGQTEALDILRRLLATHPEHFAVHHYWIHANEMGPHPEEALASAKKLVAMAPKSGHIVHMPGHVYFLIGEYEKAHDAFIASMKVDEAYMKANAVSPVDDWNYLHNLDYLASVCAEDGSYIEGIGWSEVLREIPVDPSRMDAVGIGHILYGGHTAAARIQIRYGFWDLAARSLAQMLAHDSVSSELARGYYEGLLEFARGMGASSKSDYRDADHAMKELDGLVQRLSRKKPALGADWYFAPALKILAANLLQLRGVISGGLGDVGQCVSLLQEAVAREKALGYWEPPHYARPATESLAEVFLKAKDWRKARETYEDALRLRPNSGHALFGIARTYALAGENTRAAKAYRKFLRAWSRADSDLPQVKEAKQWLETNHVSDESTNLRNSK